ncbi:hypothetical protein WJX72_008416 [[Myrmecia] bisecta]|uniref:Battenin n=1 Tax=[Myrmecia] bisecta TaxID=41462 RepID=A0AAW1P968_9CHLO
MADRSGDDMEATAGLADSQDVAQKADGVRPEHARNLAAFWSLGLLNNAAYVIMIAGANEISSGAVGLVYFCAIFPTFVVKLTGPYWFHYVSYTARMWTIAALMAGAYSTVALTSSLSWQLLGVVLSSLQGGLGEASCLALCSFYDSRKVLTFWSSGTGFAGVAGYTWVAALHMLLGLSFAATLLLANLTSLMWLLATSHDSEPAVHTMGLRERLRRTLLLWPYMGPLCLVYFAEYVMQSGVWSVMGFPVGSPDARHRFYTYSNWTYQLGVFVSRSSGLAYQADRSVLWLMPGLQVALLAFFSWDAVLHFWYNYSILLLCLLAGLLGGAVYVNAFTLISKEVEPRFREFSLSAASLGDSVGIALADITAIFIQGCLYKANHIVGASYTC